MFDANKYYKLCSLSSKRKRLETLKAYGDFWHFCIYMDYGFFKSRESILKPIACDMQRLIRPLPGMTELDMLNVSLPPRTGKSYLCTLFNAWAIGHFPHESIMRNTVTGTLHEKFTGDLIDILNGETHKKRYFDVFEKQTLIRKSVKKGIKIKASRQGVTYFGSGFEGKIIGFGATLLSIVDDSVADEWEAMNENCLEKKWKWYTSAMDSREEENKDRPDMLPCKKLFIGTRWSKLDIVGRLESLGMFKGNRCKNIAVPALINGKSYCENIHSTESLLKKKRMLSDLIWCAEWMQQPIEAKGLVFPPSQLNRFSMKDLRIKYTEDILKRPDGCLTTIDIADEGTDSLAQVIAYKYDNYYYIIDVLFTTEATEVTQPLVAAKINRYAPDKICFESNFGGKDYAKNVQKLINVKRKCRWHRTTQNKHTRILMKSGFIKEYFYFRDDFEPGSEYDKFFTELTGYNKTGKVAHDDAADVTTMMAELVDRSGWGWKK